MCWVKDSIEICNISIADLLGIRAVTLIDFNNGL